MLGPYDEVDVRKIMILAVSLIVVLISLHHNYYDFEYLLDADGTACYLQKEYHSISWFEENNFQVGSSSLRLISKYTIPM